MPIDMIGNAGAATAEVALRRLQRVLTVLLRFPASAPAGRVAGVRELEVAKTPLVVLYRVAGEEVQIVAVIHHARRWQQP